MILVGLLELDMAAVLSLRACWNACAQIRRRTGQVCLSTITCTPKHWSHAAGGD